MITCMIYTSFEQLLMLVARKKKHSAPYNQYIPGNSLSPIFWDREFTYPFQRFMVASNNRGDEGRDLNHMVYELFLGDGFKIHLCLESFFFQLEWYFSVVSLDELNILESPNSTQR